AVVVSPDDGGVILTGRLSVGSHAWLADHQVGDVVLLPGTAFAELAIRAGDQVGCDLVEELTVHTPLVVPELGAVQVRVLVGASDGDNVHRKVAVYSRPQDARGEADWIRHAEGVLANGAGAEPVADPVVWPPVGAVAMEVADAYDRLLRRAYGYGPAFHGLRAAWRRGDEIFAEVALPEQIRSQAGEFGLHPALMDAALQVILLGDSADDGGVTVLPASWRGVALHAAGASVLRVRVAPGDEDGWTLTAGDESGRPVVTVKSLTWAPVPPEALASAHGGHHDSLFRVEWQPLPDALLSSVPPVGALVEWSEAVRSDRSTTAPDLVLLSCPAASGEVPEDTRAAARDVLGAVQSWLADERFTDSKLVVATSGVVDGADVRLAPVWGLVRAAEAENPGRFVLADLDDSEESRGVLVAVAALGEPEVAIRRGEVRVPRLTRVSLDASASSSAAGAHPAPASGTVDHGPLATLPWDAEGTVLITDGVGPLGGLLARHLVTVCGVRHLMLTGDDGPATPGAAELVAELTAAGAEVEVVACAAADREALARVLTEIPAGRPLRGVVHTAGAWENRLVGEVTPEAMSAALRSKADAAWHLHELTKDLDLSAFVLLSGAGGLLMAAGQAPYAAATVFLDALAEHRVAQGLPATSLAYGPWEARADLGEGERARMRRQGVLPLPLAEGLALFDVALCGDAAVAVPIRLDTGALRARAASDEIPALLRGVLRVPVRQSVRDHGHSSSEAYAQRLAGLPAVERRRTVLDLVRTHVASVLGHASVDAVGPDRPFQELGFDSLSAVELRNRLNAVTGLLLPSTLVFDYPTAQAAAEHIDGLVAPERADDAHLVLAELDQLEALLGSVPLASDAGSRVTARLDVLLRKWQATRDEVVAEDELSYATATDEELFDALDGELGMA
ncbi:KR domain-containing protein, partial [Streptomyces griseoviridis]